MSEKENVLLPTPPYTKPNQNTPKEMFLPYLSMFQQVRAIEPCCSRNSSQVAKYGVYVREHHISGI